MADIIPPTPTSKTNLVVDQLVAEFQNRINNGADPDLTSDEREWLFDFYGSVAFRELLIEMLNAFGMEHALDMIAKIGLDESNSVAFLPELCDEDPEYIATVYANEIADVYFR